MDKFKKIFFILFFLISFIVTFFYCFFLFVFPFILNNKFDYIANQLENRYSLKVETNGFSIKTKPSLKIYIEFDDFAAYKNNDLVVYSKDFSAKFNLFDFSHSDINVDSLKINGDKLFNFVPQNSSSIPKEKIKFYKLPNISLNELFLEYKKNSLLVRNFCINSEYASFFALIKTPFLDNDLILGNKGDFSFSDGTILANSFNIVLGNSTLILDGMLWDSNENIFDFRINGFDLPVSDISKTLLFYQKSQDPAKKFIENFTDFQGEIDINLNIKNSGVFGKCIASELKAKSIWFDIPLYFKNAIFYFDKDKITSVSEGFVGSHKAVHTLDITKLGTMNKDVSGSFSAVLDDNFKYVPNLSILNSVRAKVLYNISNKKITVDYNLKLPIGSDLIYNNAFLGLRDKERAFSAQTLKDGDDLKLTKYDYSILLNQVAHNIISGDGLLKKVNGKLTPQFITCKTNGFAPVSVTGSFDKYVDGGEFNGSLKYDFITSQIFGDFEIINTRFKNYFVKSAKIIADKSVLLTVTGEFYKQYFNGKIEAKNQLGNSIYVYTLDLFLDKFIIRKGKNKTRFNSDTFKKLDISSKVREFDVTIENWKIIINEIQKDRLFLQNIELVGSLKDDVFDFLMKELAFAKGTLSGSGNYNFNDDSSHINFIAKGIDSNSVADVLFNLKGQIQGIANATLRVDTKDSLEHIYAHCDFYLDNGYLPKLGSTEFMIKNNKKVKVSDLVNIDFSKKKALESDIKGSFDLDDSLLKNIKITTQQSFLSLFITGQYEIEKQYADVSLFGRYNKEAPNGVKVLFVPLDLILKVIFRPEHSFDKYQKEIAQIPKLKTCEANQKLFRVKLKGDLSKDKVDVQIKGIEK